MDRLTKIMIIGITFSIGIGLFFLSFTEFNSVVSTQDVVSGEKVFISTNKTAVEKFVDDLEAIEASNQDTQSKSFGIGLFVDFKDSNGDVIPIKSNLFPIPNAATITGLNGELLDYAKFQFDVFALVTKDVFVDVTVNYEVLSNDAKFLEGRAYGKGTTIDGKLDLTFEQGKKTGEVLELDFEKNEVPVKFVDGNLFRNTLEIRITSVEAVIGEGFDTQHRKWSGSYPALSVKYDADKSTRVVRDYRGIAVETLPNDIGIQVCGYDDGRLFSSQDFNAYAPKLIVKTVNGKNLLQSDDPNWGNRDADFNSRKCGDIVTGLERNTQYIFEVDGKPVNVLTPKDPFLYKAECIATGSGTVQNPKTIFPCTSNFGWSR